jgi:enoyl-CoA hydratase/carnithine racemase
MMRLIDCEIENGLLIVTLARGKANAINSEMIDQLNAALDEARRNEAVRGMVIASRSPGFFSTGFDVKEVFHYSRDLLPGFFSRFLDFFDGLRQMPKPVVAAVAGHAYAGGAMMSLACDERVMADGKYGFAVNGINIGIVFSPALLRLGIDGLGLRHAKELLMEARTFSPREAFEIGIAHELTAPEDVLPRAKQRAARLCSKPATAFGAMKRSFFEITAGEASRRERETLHHFVERWFRPESVKLRQTLIDSLTRQ